MVIGIQNYTLNQFNLTHYNQFTLHRAATIQKINGSADYTNWLSENLLGFFHMFDTNMTFPTSIPPGEAYCNFLRWERNRNQDQNNTFVPKHTFTNIEMDALRRRGIFIPPGFTYNDHLGNNSKLCHHFSSSSFLNAIDGRIPPSSLQSRLRAQQNQTLIVLNIISCISALAILYSIASSFLQPFFDRKN